MPGGWRGRGRRAGGVHEGAELRHGVRERGRGAGSGGFPRSDARSEHRGSGRVSVTTQLCAPRD